MQKTAARIHREALVIDSHADTALLMADQGYDFMARNKTGHMDHPRILEGGLNGVFLAVYMGEEQTREPGQAVQRALTLFDCIHRVVEENPDQLGLARTAGEIRQMAAGGKTAVLIGVEGGHIIENRLENLRNYFRLGARYMTLTHAFHHDWADSAGSGNALPPGNGGLSEFGRKVIAEMNDLGMLVDISHVSDQTFWDTLDSSRTPLVATHSGVRALCDHPRNLSDEMIQALADRGGVVQVVFFPMFIDPRYEEKDRAVKEKRAAALEKIREEIPIEATPLALLIDHIEHIIRLVGPDHVGLGADWDGVWALVEDVDDCAALPRVTEALFERGYSEETLKKVLGGNLLRVMENVEDMARR